MEELASYGEEESPGGTRHDALGSREEDEESICSGDASADSPWEDNADSSGESGDENEPLPDEDAPADSHNEGEDIGVVSLEEFPDTDGDSSGVGVDLTAAAEASRLIADDPCQERCQEKKRPELQNFLCPLSTMTLRERKQSIITNLAVHRETDTAMRRRGQGQCQTFFFYLPLIGRVCRGAWCGCYTISPATVNNRKKAVTVKKDRAAAGRTTTSGDVVIDEAMELTFAVEEQYTANIEAPAEEKGTGQSKKRARKEK
ncbi:hypothetical protein BBJ28_00003995 [Nothophytophthora sp. Chile5]|nr:hypothetical protein BBJ28_00003995 [Nothophytophthora sp. Chile5]